MRTPPRWLSGRCRCAAAAFRMKDANGQCRKFSEFIRRSNGARLKLAAAIRTAPSELRFRAHCAESAFEAANQCIGCIGGKILIAAFAVGPKIEHGSRPLLQIKVLGCPQDVGHGREWWCETRSPPAAATVLRLANHRVATFDKTQRSEGRGALACVGHCQN